MLCAIDYFVPHGSSHTHSYRTLTLALARLSSAESNTARTFAAVFVHVNHYSESFKMKIVCVCFFLNTVYSYVLVLSMSAK